jgi:hypothetical protein
MGFGGNDFFGSNLSLGQAMFMAEEEGVTDIVDSPDARFNAALKEIRKELAWAKGIDRDSTYEVNEILYKYDIMPSSLTKNQVRRIQRAIE